MQHGARISLAALVAAAALVVGVHPDTAAGASDGMQSVTYDVATRTERRDTVRRTLSSASHDLARALGRSGSAPLGAQDADERPSPRKIFGADDREPVYDTESYPWSTVAKVFASFPDGTVFEGSAVMVDRDQALTAAHMIYDDRHGGWASDVEVVPGYDLGYAPFGSYFAADLRAFSGWTDRRDYAYDIAVIDLDAAAGDVTGWLGIAARDESELLGGLLNTAGYPGDLDDGAGMWYAADYAADVDDSAIYLNGTFDAAQGQSGSGVWLREDDSRYVVGVVSTETYGDNVATRITGDVFDVLDAWLDGFDGPADLAPTAVETTLPFRAEPGAAGSVSFEVDNFGLRGATVPAVAYLEDASGVRRQIGARDVSVAAGEWIAVDLPVALPGNLPAATYNILVVTDPDHAVPDADRSNDVARGPLVAVAASGQVGGGDYWEPIVLPARPRARLVPNGEARYSFDVTTSGKKLRFRLRGRRFLGFAIVVRPDGSTFQLLPRSAFRYIENQAQAGEWLVLVKNRPDAGRSRRFKLTIR